MFRRDKTDKTRKDCRYSFIHYLKWNWETNTPYQLCSTRKKRNSKKEIEEIISNCLDEDDTIKIIFVA